MSKTILLIEDNVDMADNISSILRLAHYNVVVAYDGKTGVEIAQTQQVDLILCDIMMPELDGYGVLHILNKEPETSRIPFIFLTAKADKADLRTGMNLGADDYITKPFDGFDLLKVVEIRLKKNALLRSEFRNNVNDINSFFSQARELRDFQKLSENRPSRLYKKREFIFMEGQKPNELFFLTKGKVKTYKLNSDGKELITGLYGQGDFLGYIPLLEDKPHHENAEALEESEIMIIPRQDFLTLLYSSRDVAHKFIKLLSNNLAQAEERLIELAYQSVRQRVAGALLSVSERYDDSRSKISIGRRDLSNLIGTATESLNRTLADFKEEALIEIVGEGIRILDKARLERIKH